MEFLKNKKTRKFPHDDAKTEAADSSNKLNLLYRTSIARYQPPLGYRGCDWGM
jgi:hypothetical protein